MLQCCSCEYCQKCELKNGRYTVKCNKSGEIIVNQDFEQTFNCADYKASAVEFPPDIVIMPDNEKDVAEVAAKELYRENEPPVKLRFYFKSGAFLDETLPSASQNSVAMIISGAMKEADDNGFAGFLSFNDQLIRFDDISAAAIISD